MAAPTYVLSETNGATVVTDNIPTIAFASIDSASTAGLSAANPIQPSANAFEKYERLKCTGAATTQASAFSFYFPNQPVDSGATGSPNVVVNYSPSAGATYATPVATNSILATAAVTTNTAPSGQTLTFASAGVLNSYSGYMAFQLKFGAAVAGGPVNFNGNFLYIQYSWS